MALIDLKENLAELLADFSATPRDITRSKFADLTVKTAFRFEDKEETAKRIAERLEEAKSEWIDGVKVAGAYVNVFLNRRKLASALLKEVFNARYGSMPSNGEKIVLEHTSVNPTGPIHIGRFRNPVIGDSLRRILTFLGYEVETHYYVNDVGRQMALIALAFEKGIEPDQELVKKWGKYAEKNDFQVFFRYVPAYKLSEENEDFKKEVDEFLFRAENGDEDLLAKLKKTAGLCLTGMKETLSRCGFHYDVYDYESDLIASGKVKEAMDLVSRLGVKKLDTGALAVDLGMGRDTVIARPDGTSVYLIRDLAYHIEKLKKGYCINVLGEDHKLEAKELKALLNAIGQDGDRLETVHFSFVDLAGRKMSTRRGETVPVDAVLDEGKEKALIAIKEKNPDLENKEEVAEKVSIGAIKYFLIRVDPMKRISFNWEEALRFEGDTGPYLQYTHARARSILRKATSEPRPEFESVNNNEWELVLKLAEFPEVVLEAGSQRKPNLIANYLYSLASLFNEFYHKEKVIGSDKEEERLAIVKGVAIVLNIGLDLLGIHAPERM